LGSQDGRRFGLVDVRKLTLMAPIARHCGQSPTAAAQVVPEMLERARELIVMEPETGEICTMQPGVARRW
jgi:hypothetical protein